MKIALNKPPRVFGAGKNKRIKISDCGRIRMKNNEQVTFVTPEGREYDLAAKSWGFYATPSVNGRLKKEGFKTALVKNRIGRIYCMIVDAKKMPGFKCYLKSEESKVIKWLDEL